jgi:hypothetical protein
VIGVLLPLHIPHTDWSATPESGDSCVCLTAAQPPPSGREDRYRPVSPRRGGPLPAPPRPDIPLRRDDPPHPPHRPLSPPRFGRRASPGPGPMMDRAPPRGPPSPPPRGGDSYRPGPGPGPGPGSGPGLGPGPRDVRDVRDWRDRERERDMRRPEDLADRIGRRPGDAVAQPMSGYVSLVQQCIGLV